MSDDLISREEVLKLLYEIKDNNSIPKNYGTILDIINGIRKMPMAFDKEKVINEIMQLDCKMDECDLYKSCLDHALFMAKEVVEKGGITCL